MDRGKKRFLVLAALVVGAVIRKELRKSPDQRTWQGKLGFVPYDLRFPTAERVRSTFWDADNPHVVVPHVYGVGWSINSAALVKRVRRLVG